MTVITQQPATADDARDICSINDHHTQHQMRYCCWQHLRDRVQPHRDMQCNVALYWINARLQFKWGCFNNRRYSNVTTKTTVVENPGVSNAEHVCAYTAVLLRCDNENSDSNYMKPTLCCNTKRSSVTTMTTTTTKEGSKQESFRLVFCYRKSFLAMLSWCIKSILLLIRYACFI